MLAFQAVLWYNTAMKNKTNFGTSNTEMMTISRAEYDADKAYIAELEQQNRWLMEQMSLLFNEAEAYAHMEQKTETTVKEHTRRKNSGSVQDVIPKDILVEEIIHELPEDQRMCPPSAAKKWSSSAQRFMSL